MALVKCRECGAEVSSKAKKCPHCGISNPARSQVATALSALVILAGGLAIVTFSGKPTAAGNATAAMDSPSNSPSGAVGASANVGDNWIAPLGASSADRAAMQSWFEQDELCRGSYDVATIHVMCPKRKQTQDALRRRGWCWEYEDVNVYPPDFQWHRCSEKTLPLDKRSVRPEGNNLGDNDASISSNVGQDSVDHNPTESDSSLASAGNGPEQRRIDDARAMIRESWANYGQSIQAIEIGYKCGVVDHLSASVAIDRFRILMQDAMANEGLSGDPSMNLKTSINSYVTSGIQAVKNGACSSMTPAMRGRLRSMVTALMRQ